MNELVVESTNGERKLTFRDYDGDYVTVTCGNGSVHARLRVYLYTMGSAIADFFAELAINWRGWSGTKQLESIERDLRLEATTDRLGHVELRISLSHQHPEDNWKVEIPIFLDAGSLEPIAARARRFFE